MAEKSFGGTVSGTGRQPAVLRQARHSHQVAALPFNHRREQRGEGGHRAAHVDVDDVGTILVGELA
jgi:hypothetical protein